MSRTASNLAALFFAVILTGVTFQQALIMPDAPRPAPASYTLA